MYSYHDVLTPTIAIVLAALGSVVTRLMPGNGRQATRLRLIFAFSALAAVILSTLYVAPPADKAASEPGYVSVLTAGFAVAMMIVSCCGLRLTRGRRKQGLTAVVVVMGLAFSVTPSWAMAELGLTADSVLLAASEISQESLLFVVVVLTLLALVMLCFMSFQQSNISVWKTLLLVGFSELVVMLMIPAILPGDAPLLLKSLLDMGLLMLLMIPVAWRLHKTGNHLYYSRLEAEKNLATQSAIVELLTLPLNRLDLQELLGHALKIICNITWLQDSAKGAIFLNDAAGKMLSLAAQYNMP